MTNSSTSRRIQFLLATAALLASASLLAGAAPLRAGELAAAIDRRIAAGMNGPAAPTADDAEFCRRVWLDLAGVIPSAHETRSFLADTDPVKRTKLIDRLLASPHYPSRMQEAVSVMLLDRRAGKAIDDASWNAWLRAAFAENRPWDALVRELIAADGADPATRPAIRFFVDGGRDPSQTTLDLARIFLGVNWQCNQCHDHPTIGDYRQSHFYGLLAFVSPSKTFVDKERGALLFETVVSAKTEFVSVFLPEEMRSTGPKLLQLPELSIPEFAAGEEFLVPPVASKSIPGVPKFQPRRELARLLTSPANRAFARNAVNRFWFLLMGRGIAHPLDLQHSGNPPSHPELLEELTDAFIAHGHDVKWLLREIAHSEAYQRSSVAPSGVPAAELKPAEFRIAAPRGLSPEQMARSLALGLGQAALIDGPPAADSKFTHKDYVNGRLPPPDNWPDVQKLFAAVFGHPAGQAEVDFRPSVEQSLFLNNDPLIAQWLAARGDSLTARLANEADASKLAAEAWLSLLSRLPTAEERSDATAFLQAAADRPAAIRDLCQALITAAEFRLNH